MRNMLRSNSVFIVRSLKSLLFIVGPPKSQQISAEMQTCKHVNNRPRDRLTIGFVIVLVLIIIIDHYHYHYHCNCHNEQGTKE